MNKTRARQLNDKQLASGPILYWMQREHRTRDNWAILFAQELAIQNNTQLEVVFALRHTFPDATERLISHMLSGLEEVAEDLAALQIPFTFLVGSPEKVIQEYCEKNKVGAVVTDFHALKTERMWRKKLAETLSVPLYEVDARNIIPCWVASPKQEFGAYTLRPKYLRQLNTFLEDFPLLKKQTTLSNAEETNWEEIKKHLVFDKAVPEITEIVPGEKAAKKVLNHFIEQKLESYEADRNDPTLMGQSGLSPYLHFGHISAQRVVLEVEKSHANTKSKAAFIEEITVRRELADNYCFYNSDYDNPKGFPDWAKKTIAEHADDRREFDYSLDELAQAQTHDSLWNAAQTQAVKTGMMHGYLRMYWAKKIFEWSSSAALAQQKAIQLMDRYFIDGREPNGFAGIAWSMGGVHDRAWTERPIFGKLRYMNFNGCKRKFDVEKFIQQVTLAQPK